MRFGQTFRRVLLSAVAFAFVAGCGDGPAAPTGDEGTIAGKVTAADGVTPVALAEVWVQSQGRESATTTDAAGSYTLSRVPAGSQTIMAEKGTFRSTTTVDVRAGQVVTAPVAALAPTGRLGYVAGSFDHIEDIVRDLGYPVEEIALEDLTNAGVLSQYKVIFLNCGAGVWEDAAPALKAWVQAGGLLYASDWELTVVRAMFPNDVLQVGSGNEQVVTATVTDVSLQQFIGKPTAEVAFDLSAWQMLVSLSTTPRVLLRASVQGMDLETGETVTYANQPLAFTMALGEGTVVYTTFHNEAGVTQDQLAVLRYFIHL